jgi:PrtD family type I secretion system ABC transporter
MLAVVSVIALLLLFGLDQVRGQLWAAAGTQLDQWLTSEALSALLEERARQHQQTHLDALRDIATVRQFLSGPLVQALFDLPWFLVYLVIIFLFHPWLGFTALIGAGLLLGIAWLNERQSQPRVQQFKNAQRRVEQTQTQFLRNAEVIVSLGMTERMVCAWAGLKAVAAGAESNVFSTNLAYKNLTRFVRQLLQIVMMGVGAWLVIDQLATPGVMLAGTILLGKALAPVEVLVGAWKQLVEVRHAYPRLKQLSEPQERPTPLRLPVPVGRVSVERVVYRPLPSKPAIIKDLSFELGAGELLAVLGPSASGKSTLARLLIGVWKPQMGAVRLDGADVSQWPHAQLGQHIGYVPQDVELFFGTVAENIARSHRHADPAGQGNDADAVATAVIQAAKRAGIHDMVLRLPGGYDTEIGDSGVLLSGGQRQRVALARALYGNPALVVLDEPNASLDDAGERALRDTLQALKTARVTVVVITHRHGLLGLADKILVLRDGQIEQFGPRDKVQRWLHEPRPAQSAAPLRLMGTGAP